MFCVNDINVFQLCRGDTFIFPININGGTKLYPEQYELLDTDIIYGAILEPNQAFEDAIIRKKITKNSKTDKDGFPLFILESEDTEYLLTGKYYFTLKLVTKENVVTTILPMKEFFITGTDKDPCCNCC